MIAKKINILPGLTKGNDKRLSLTKKQNIQNILATRQSISTNNENTQNKRNSQTNKFRINRAGRFSVSSKRIPFNLIFQTNQEIKAKNNQVKRRSLSSLLLFGFQKNQASRLAKSDKNYHQLDLESISSKAIDFENISQQKQKYISKNEQKYMVNQFLLIKNQHKKDEIKQNFAEFSKSSINQTQKFHIQQNIQKIVKQVVSIGVTTDFQMKSESYKDFLKFKITKNQKYNQIEELFQFIQKLYSHEIIAFGDRQKEMKQLYIQCMPTQRELQMSQITKKIEDSQKNIEQFMKNTIKQIQMLNNKIVLQIKSEMKKVYQELNSIKNYMLQFNQKSTQNSQENTILQNLILYSNIQGEHSINLNKGTRKKNNISQINQRFSKITKLITKIQEKTKKFFQLQNQKLSNRLQTIQKKLFNFKQCHEKKDIMIQICIDQLLKLPQMSMTIFGMNNAMNEENQTLKKIGVFLDEIPEFESFYSKNNVLKNIDKTFEQLMNTKCMNCSYLKSKMRFVHNKNKQLQPTIKILNSLLKNQRKSSL